MSETYSILVDPYRSQCKFFQKKADGSWGENDLFKNYDLSWVNESAFWYELYKDQNRASGKIQTNSWFLCAYLTAKILGEEKKFELGAFEPQPDDFSERVHELKKFLEKSSVPEKKIFVHISEESRAGWNDFKEAQEKLFRSLHLNFEETDNLKKAEFLLVQEDEFNDKYQNDLLEERKHAVCFVICRDQNVNCIQPKEWCGTIWYISGEDSDAFIYSFLDFFYLKTRFIELSEHCIKKVTIETLDEVRELIALRCSCDKKFLEEANTEKILYLLVDNSKIQDVKLGENAVFRVHEFCDGCWQDDDEKQFTTAAVPADYTVGRTYDYDADLKELYSKSFGIEARDVFVFTPEKHLISKTFSEAKVEKIKVRFRVIADGGTDNFGIRCHGKTDANGVYLHPLGSSLKLNVWINNRREYNEQAHPLLCTLNGEKILPVEGPVRNSTEVVYTFEIKFSEVKSYTFKMQLGGMTGVAQCTFKALPPADAIYVGVKPVTEKARLESQWSYYSTPVAGGIKQVKRITCFTGSEFSLGTAVFNRNNLLALLPGSEAQVTPQKIFEKCEKSCYDAAWSWDVCLKSSENVCDVSATHIKALKNGSCQLKFECCSDPQIFQKIEFVFLADKSEKTKKLLVAGLIISFISAFWYGAGFPGLLFKIFCPAVVYYVATHPEECLKNSGNKVLFWIALVVSFFVLLRGLWEEII